jgi:hypothetical protein
MYAALRRPAPAPRSAPLTAQLDHINLYIMPTDECALTVQNRELQIMRLVSHPNVVELKAFFYSNGEKVRLCSSRRFALI